MTGKDDILLVMTACINPGSDADRRHQEYLQAFTYWLDHPDPRLTRILFIENSGSDLSEFRRRAARNAKQIEFISLDTNRLRPPKVHYGYSEMRMLDDALSTSELAKTSALLIKVTGRLIFPTLPRLLDRLPEKMEGAFDCRRNHVTTQLFLCTPAFYAAHLEGAYRDFGAEWNTWHMENIYFTRLKRVSVESNMLLRFPVNCSPSGRAGHWGKNYSSLKERSKSAVRAVARVIAPWWWV
jgi:hypothetical protein